MTEPSIEPVLEWCDDPDFEIVRCEQQQGIVVVVVREPSRPRPVNSSAESTNLPPLA